MIIRMSSAKVVQRHVKVAHLPLIAKVVMAVLNLEFFQEHHAFAWTAILIQEQGLRYANNVVTHVQHAQQRILHALLVQGQLEIQLPLVPALIGIMMMVFTQIVWPAITHVSLVQMEIPA